MIPIAASRTKTATKAGGGTAGTGDTWRASPTQSLSPSVYAAMITRQEKRGMGSMMGSNRFRMDMPRYVDFYLDGGLKLDEMISGRIGLEDVNDAFEGIRRARWPAR